MHLTLHFTVPSSVTPTPRVLQVAGMFGLGVDETREVTVIPPTSIELRSGRIVFITGASGSGKSTILRLIAQAAAGDPGIRAIRFDDLPSLPDQPLVDCFDTHLARDDEAGSLPAILRWLSLAGLGDAFVLLRRPAELSDGQRYRLRLAQVFAMVEQSLSRGDAANAPLHLVLADEFGAALDRVTASVLARNVRKWVSRAAVPVCFVAATTHDDLLEPLEPDVLIEKRLGEGITVAVRQREGEAPAEPSACARPALN